MRDVPAAIGRCGMVRESVDLNHKMASDDGVHVVTCETDLLTDRHAEPAQAYDEDRLKTRVGSAADGASERS